MAISTVRQEPLLWSNDGTQTRRYSFNTGVTRKCAERYGGKKRETLNMSATSYGDNLIQATTNIADHGTKQPVATCS